MPMHIHTDEAVRDASSTAVEDLEKFSIEQQQREDVYAIFQQYIATKYAFESGNLTIEENRCVKNLQRSYRRRGLRLESAADRAAVTELKKRLTELETQFQNNTNEVKTSFEYCKADLIGLPDDWFSTERLIRDDIYKVGLKYPDVFPILDYCQNRQTRARICAAFNSQCAAENTPLLLEAVQLRQQMAAMLGYKSYADYATEEKMTKNADNVAQFLQDMNTRFIPLQRKTLNELTDFARMLENDPQFELHLYDMRYYIKLREKQLCDVDHKAISNYFNTNKIVSGTLDIYQSILGLRFEKTEINSAWHPEVTYYKVYDSATNELLGDFYLDLYPREGKYGHAAVFDLIEGSDLSKFTGQHNARRPHSYAMLCNFPKNEGVSFNDVTTFFHEFGHVMHGICSRTQLCQYKGMNNELDFVEAPSQMLENWCYDVRVLEKLSAHRDTGAVIPAAMVKKIRDSEKLHAGYTEKRQLSFSTFDFMLHNLSLEQLSTLDLKRYWQQMQYKITLLPMSDDCFPASFGHLMSGYQVGYYGYMYSNVVALDMFAARFANDPLNVAAGMLYRKCILEPGATKDASELVRDFLGREPRIDAYLQHRGFEAEVAKVLPRVELQGSFS